MSDSEKQRQWYAVRSTFELEPDRGRRVFEQKIFLYLVPTAELALRHAESDSAIYLEDNENFTQVAEYDVFELGHDLADLSGREVWSFVSYDEPK